MLSLGGLALAWLLASAVLLPVLGRLIRVGGQPAPELPPPPAGRAPDPVVRLVPDLL